MSTRSATGSLPPPVLDRPTSELAALDAVIANSSDADDDERDAAPFENEPESEEDELFKPGRRGRKCAGSSVADTASVASSSQAVAAPRPARKKKKKSLKGARQGRLSAILERMPVEILSEILSHLTPNMLLRMARLARVFRQLLMSKKSTSIWKDAFANDGIGEFEAEDMSLPQIASLMWDKECALCHRTKVHKVCYYLRQRVCDTCYKTKLTTGHLLLNTYPDKHPDMLKCVPSAEHAPSRSVPYMIPIQTVYSRWYLEPTYLEMAAKFDQILAEKCGDDGEVLSDQPSKEEKEAQVQAIVAHYEELLPKALRDAEMLTKWQVEHDRSRVDDKSTLRKDRRLAIIQRSQDAGFEPEDINQLRNENSKVWNLIDQPYALTDRVWRKISVPIFEYLREVAAVREEAARIQREEQARRAAIEEQKLKLRAERRECMLVWIPLAKELILAGSRKKSVRLGEGKGKGQEQAATWASSSASVFPAASSSASTSAALQSGKQVDTSGSPEEDDASLSRFQDMLSPRDTALGEIQHQLLAMLVAVEEIGGASIDLNNPKTRAVTQHVDSGDKDSYRRRLIQIGLRGRRLEGPASIGRAGNPHLMAVFYQQMRARMYCREQGEAEGARAALMNADESELTDYIVLALDLDDADCQGPTNVIDDVEFHSYEAYRRLLQAFRHANSRAWPPQPPQPEDDRLFDPDGTNRWDNYGRHIDIILDDVRVRAMIFDSDNEYDF